MRGLRFISSVTLSCALLCGTAGAEEALSDLPLASSPYVHDTASFRLAADDRPATLVTRADAPPPMAAQPFEPPLFTFNKVHQYMGLSTIVLAGLTALTAPDDGCGDNGGCTSTQPRPTHGTHAHLAEATVAMAGLTILSGLAAHWDDFKLSDGIRDPDNQHILLGVTGAGLMAWAVNRSKNSTVPISHAGIAELGALLMVAAIKITW